MNSLSKNFNTNKFTLFLDRDNTIIVDNPYQSGNQKIELIFSSIDILSKLQKYCNYFIVTNQSGINRKKFNLSSMHVFNDRLLDKLKKYKIEIVDIKYCPHKPEDNCKCRKPEPKLINDLCNEYHIDRNKAAFIGDKDSDRMASINANIRYFYSCKNYKKDKNLWNNIYKKITSHHFSCS